MSRKGVLVALTNAVEGREEEFNKWYNEVHLPDVLKIPGIIGAKRYRLSNDQRGDGPFPYRYLAIYEIEADKEQSVAEELGKRSGTDKMPLSDTLVPERIVWFFDDIPGGEIRLEPKT